MGSSPEVSKTGSASAVLGRASAGAASDLAPGRGGQALLARLHAQLQRGYFSVPFLGQDLDLSCSDVIHGLTALRDRGLVEPTLERPYLRVTPAGADLLAR